MSIEGIEGVTATVQAAMTTLHANVLAEDGLLLRTCEHSIRHPVGSVHKEFLPEEKLRKRHELRATVPAECCGCCSLW